MTSNDPDLPRSRRGPAQDQRVGITCTSRSERGRHLLAARQAETAESKETTCKRAALIVAAIAEQTEAIMVECDS